MIDLFASGADFAAGKAIDKAQHLVEQKNLPNRLAREAHERANRRGVDFRAEQLAAVLRAGHLQTLVRRGTAEDILSAKAHLSAVEPLSELELSQARDVLFDVVERLLRENTPQGVLIADLQDDVREQGQYLRDTGSSRANFEANLLRFPWPFREDLRDLDARGVQSAARIAAELVPSPARSSRLAEWSKNPPSWLPRDDAAVFGWLAELATATDAAAAARNWISRALEAGATPRAYWKYLEITTLELSAEVVEATFADVADHPVARSVLPSMDIQNRVRSAENWVPETQNQRAVQDVLLVSLYAAADRIDATISLGSEALVERDNLRAGLIAGEYLVHRAGSANLTSHASDLQAALDIGLRVRDACRAFGFASAGGVELAVEANTVLGDLKSAWELTQPEPVGSATEGESNAANVADCAVRVLLDLGQTARAEALVDDKTRRYTSALVAAAAALEAGDDAAAVDRFREAFIAATDDDERAEVCLQLAHLGNEHEWLSRLETLAPEFGADVRLIARLYAEAPRAEALAKERGQHNRRLAFEHARFLRRKGRHRDAGDSFARLATKWNARDDHFNAALCYLDVPDLAAASRSLANAVAGDAHWPQLPQALIAQVQVATRLLDYDVAITAARHLRTLAPRNDDYRWMHIRVLYQSGSEEDATREILGDQDLAIPRTPEEAAVWLAVYRQQGSNMATVELLREVALQFQNGDGIKELAISCMLHAPGSVSTTEINFVTLHHDFEAHELGSSPMAIIDVAGLTGREMLEKMEQVAGNTPDFAAIDELLRSGRLPLGVFAGFTGRNMAETLIANSSSRRYLTLPPDNSRRAEVPAEHERVVIDLTALITLARLPEELREILVNHFALDTSLMQYRDARISAEALGVDTVGRVLRSTEDLPSRFAETSSEQQRLHRHTASNAVSLMRSMNRPARTGKHLPLGDFPEEFVGETWTLAGETALDLDLPLWCDDRSTRELLGLRGVATFSTLELVEALEEASDLTARDVAILRALLLNQWITDVPFDDDVYRDAIRLSGHDPAAAAAALEVSGAEHAIDKLKLYLWATEQSAENPEALAGWAESAGTYATSLFSDVEALKGTLGYLLANWLVADWLDHSQFQIVTEALRKASPIQIVEVLEHIFPTVYEAFSGAFEAKNAFAVMRHRVSLLPENEQRAILWLMLKAKE